MKRVLLTLENPSKSFIDDTFRMFGTTPPYAVLLLDRYVTEKYTIEPRIDDIDQKIQSKTISSYDRVPHTHYSYDQACIIYFTKEDYENGNGTYWEFMPEEIADDMYEYKAQLI